ncbi:MAG: hypothetical protein U0414_36915 [Polyangiaceae bacterium]
MVASLGILACRSNGDDNTGGAGSTSGTMSTGTKMSTSSGTTTTGSNTTSSGQGGGGGGPIGCSGPEHTVQEISDGTLGTGLKISVKGAVAMSQLFLVSGAGPNPSSCLWGVFISAPGLTETGPHTGAIALSYGSPPAVPSGGVDAFCPALGKDPVGSKFADDIKPGDVIDLVGVTDEFPTMFANCADPPPQGQPPNPLNTVGMIQLSQVCSATKTGTTAPPTPHVMTPAELAKVTSTTDADFHHMWGGVKVRLNNMKATAVTEFGLTLDDASTMPVEAYDVNRKAWYRPLSPNKDCHYKDLAYPVDQVFTSVEAFHYLNFCTWGFTVSDRCGDFEPSSMGCMAKSITTCNDTP